jgi:hypothetical protein
MAGKTGKMVSLEAIEEHLKRQDKEIAKSHMVTFASFGAAVALVGVSAWLARIPNITIRDYAFFIILGLAAMGIALCWVSRIDRIKVEKPLKELDKKSDRKMNLSPWLSFTFAGFSVFLAGWVGIVEAPKYYCRLLVPFLWYCHVPGIRCYSGWLGESIEA